MNYETISLSKLASQGTLFKVINASPVLIFLCGCIACNQSRQFKTDLSVEDLPLFFSTIID